MQQEHISITLLSWSFQRSVLRLTSIRLSLLQREEVEKRTTKTSDWQQSVYLTVPQETSAVERWREGLTLLPGVPNGRERLETVVVLAGVAIFYANGRDGGNIFMFG